MSARPLQIALIRHYTRFLKPVSYTHLQSYVVKGGQMVQQAEVLKNDADFPPQHGKVVTVGEVNVGSKNVDRTAARFLCEIHHTEPVSYTHLARILIT